LRSPFVLECTYEAVMCPLRANRRRTVASISCDADRPVLDSVRSPFAPCDDQLIVSVRLAVADTRLETGRQYLIDFDIPGPSSRLASDPRPAEPVLLVLQRPHRIHS
jgi:hypothetical protein